MRIKRNCYYALRRFAAFQSSAELPHEIVTGHKAGANRTRVVGEYLASGRGWFECDDGHWSGYRPILPEVEALRFLDANPFQAIHPLGNEQPAKYRVLEYAGSFTAQVWNGKGYRTLGTFKSHDAAGTALTDEHTKQLIAGMGSEMAASGSCSECGATGRDHATECSVRMGDDAGDPPSCL